MQQQVSLSDSPDRRKSRPQDSRVVQRSDEPSQQAKERAAGKTTEPEENTPSVLPAEPTRKSVRNRHSTLAKALGNPVPIYTIDTMKIGANKKNQFNIDSPPDKTPSPTKPSLKSLIHGMGFSIKTPSVHEIPRGLSAQKKDKHHDKTEIIDLNRKGPDGDIIIIIISKGLGI